MHNKEHRLYLPFRNKIHLSPSSLYPLPGHLSSVQSTERGRILVFRPFNLLIGSGEDDLEVYGVSLIRVNTTVGTVSTTASFLKIDQKNWVSVRRKVEVSTQIGITYGCLLDIDITDIQVLKIKVLGIGVRFGILEETKHESDGFLGPATWLNDFSCEAYR